MKDTKIIERLVAVEEREKSNTKRLDEHDKKFKEQEIKIDNLEKAYSIMKKMDYRIGNVEDNIKKINENYWNKIEIIE